MSWRHAMMLVVLVSCILPAVVALIPRKPKRHFVQRDIVAHRHRAIVRNGFKTRAGIR